MTHYKIDDRTLRLMSAQVNLSSTFSHTLRNSEPRRLLPFHLQVERSQNETQFTVHMSSERHSLSLPHTAEMHLKLANFIEEIANGPRTAEVSHHALPDTCQRLVKLYPETCTQIYGLVLTGGTLNVHAGFEHPVVVAIHREITGSAITAIVSLNQGPPRTQCFSASGDTSELCEKVTEAIHRIALGVPPAAHAA